MHGPLIPFRNIFFNFLAPAIGIWEVSDMFGTKINGKRGRVTQHIIENSCKKKRIIPEFSLVVHREEQFPWRPNTHNWDIHFAIPRISRC